MTNKDLAKGVLIGAISGGVFNGVSAIINGRTFWTGTTPRISVQPITLPQPAGLAKGDNGNNIKTGDYKISSSTEPTATPTTQNNTAVNIDIDNGYVDLSKNTDFNKIVYRAVSKAELDDITEFGFRTIEGGYETGKLFAPTFEEVAQFGKNNFKWDGIPNTVIKVEVPNSVLNSAFKFGADGMNAISIPSNQLNLLKGTPINYSPWLK